MSESCCCPPEAGAEVCELPTRAPQHTISRAACPMCGKAGKPVQTQTVRALLSVSLHQVQDVQYFFCRTQTCPIVYFSAAGQPNFTVEQVRERVYQKEPDAGDVFVCYCFRHTVADIRDASHQDWNSLAAEIQAGIDAGQCACELRNPQGSCCLGNVRKNIKQFDKTAVGAKSR